MIRQLHRLFLFLLGLLLVFCLIPAVQLTGAATASTPAAQLIEQGRTLYADRQFDQAMWVWQQAQQTAEQAGDRLKESIALAYLSLTYQQFGQWAQAQTAIDRSLAILNTEQSPILAQALNIRGRLEFSLGNPETALETWQKATEIYQQLSDRVGITGSLLNQAQALEAVGLSRRACVTLLEALEVSSDCDRSNLENLNPILSRLAALPDPQVQALGFRNLGNVLRLVGYYAESQRVLEQSLSVAENDFFETSATLRSLGDTQQRLYQQAKNRYERSDSPQDLELVRTIATQALNRYRQASEAATQTAAHNLLQRQIQLQQLNLLIDLQQWLQTVGKVAEAEELEPQIQTQINTVSLIPLDSQFVSRGSIAAQIQLVQTLSRVNQQSAPELLQQMTAIVQQATALGDSRLLSYALGSLGHFYEQVGQPDEWLQARQQTEQALSLAQAQQAWDLVYRWQWQLGRLFAARGETAQAIVYYQAAIETLEVVRNNLLALDAEVQLSFREEVEPVYRELAALLLGDPNQTNLQLAVQAIEALQVSELENFLRCNLSRSVALDRDLIDADAAIVYSIVLPDRLTVILNPLGSDQLQVYTHSIASSEVNETLTTLRRELEKDVLSPDRLPPAQQVYDWLIRPFNSTLQASPVQTLVFVLDGAFRNVPMAALHDGQHYLLEDYAIALTPGLQLLPAQPLEQLRLDALSFGLSEIRSDFPPHQNFAPLVNVPIELADIKAQIPAQTRLNQQFTSADFQDAMRSSSAAIVHLATHGSFSSVLEETFILTWDQRLNLDNLSSILRNRNEATSEPIELLVLSACQTASGDNRAALGMAGVAVRSGARSTVASLWSVNDQATAVLMERFYQALAQERTLSRAQILRQAQLALLADPNYEAPFYWAAFVLVGNWL